MTGYKGVECQSLEKDMEEPKKEKEKLFPCLAWNVELNCCNAIYNSQVSKKYPNVSFSSDNFDMNCRGLSSLSKCVAFKGIELSQRELAFIKMKEVEQPIIVTQRKMI